MSTEPFVSSMSYDLALIAMMIAVVAMAALWYAVNRLRMAALGDDVLDACGGDWDTALAAIERMRIEERMVIDLAASTVARDSRIDEMLADIEAAERGDFRARVARFNEDCN